MPSTLLEFARNRRESNSSAESTDFRWASSALLAAAAVAVGFAIHLRDGEYWNRTLLDSSLHWVGVALILPFGAVLLTRRPDVGAGERALLTCLAILLAFQFYQLLRSPPSGWNAWSDDLSATIQGPGLRPYYGRVAAAGLFVAAAIVARGGLRHLCFALALGVHLSLGIWIVRGCPNPQIDVFSFQQEAAKSLLAGGNPYAIDMPDIYRGTDKERDRAVYGQGLSRDGRLAFGFPYPPASLLLSTAGYAVAGDHRYAQVVALTLAGALLGYARCGRTGMLAAGLLLFTPRAFFILGRGWTEPFVVLGLAATIWCACRRPRWLPVALGLFLATKQYLVFAAPAILLLSGRPIDWRASVRLLALSVGVAALVTAPLALWDIRAFLHSTVTVQAVAPFRSDALSFLAWYFFRTGIEPGVTAAFIAVGVGIVVGLWRAPRTPAGFAAALALIYLPFIAFNKQAFANYYLFAIAALCAAVAAHQSPSAD